MQNVSATVSKDVQKAATADQGREKKWGIQRAPEGSQPFSGYCNLTTIVKKSKNSKLKPTFPGVYEGAFVAIGEQSILFLTAC